MQGDFDFQSQCVFPYPTLLRRRRGLNSGGNARYCAEILTQLANTLREEGALKQSRELRLSFSCIDSFFKRERVTCSNRNLGIGANRQTLSSLETSPVGTSVTDSVLRSLEIC